MIPGEQLSEKPSNVQLVKFTLFLAFCNALPADEMRNGTNLSVDEHVGVCIVFI